MNNGFASFALAMKTRDVVKRFVREVLQEEGWYFTYGTVQTVDSVANTVDVIQTGEATAKTVKMGSLKPAPGQVVRMFGPPGARFIDDVLGPHVHP